MAITSNTFNWEPKWADKLENFDVTHTPLQGQMVIATFQVDALKLQAHVFSEDEIKRELIDKLLYELWNRNCIEFTKQEDHLTGTHLFRARIYALPDDQVRIVRQNNVI